MSILASVVTAAFTVLAVVLAVVSIRATRFSGTRRTLYLSVAFALFAGKGALLSIGLFVMHDWTLLLVPALLLDMAALTAMYLAVLHRSS
jgi:hypothetical protein